jgi:adenylate cyclase class IV
MDARRNVELKARDPDPDATLGAAIAHGATDEGTLRQRDVYFGARDGRLKLRIEDGGAQLIGYERADAATARLSAYHLADVPDPEATIAALGATPAAAAARRAHPPRRRRRARPLGRARGGRAAGLRPE